MQTMLQVIFAPLAASTGRIGLLNPPRSSRTIRCTASQLPMSVVTAVVVRSARTHHSTGKTHQGATVERMRASAGVIGLVMALHGMLPGARFHSALMGRMPSLHAATVVEVFQCHQFRQN